MIKAKIISFIVRLYISTFRYTVKGKDAVDRLMADKKRLVVSVWHNQLLCVSDRYEGIRLTTMISRSKDGGYFAALVESLGIHVVRASSSRGASAGTLEMLEMMNKGYHAIMAADGPKGPKFRIKMGSLYLAKKADRIIVPMFADCKRFYRFNSWDNFILPKLFAKIDITFGDPIYVSDSIDKETMEKELADIQNKLMEQTSVYSKNII